MTSLLTAFRCAPANSEPFSTRTQAEQPYWAQDRGNNDGAAAPPPSEQHWERRVDNPTFVETAAASGPQFLPDAASGVDSQHAVPVQQPPPGAETEAPPAAEPATTDYSGWSQQPQITQTTDGSSPDAWQPQANGWHMAGGGGEQHAEGGWQGDDTQAQGLHPQAYAGQADVSATQWDSTAQQGDHSRQGLYGQQQLPSEEQYPAVEGGAVYGAQAQWEQLQQYGSTQAADGAQQIYNQEQWSNGDGQQWQQSGAETGEVRTGLSSKG